MPARRLRCHDLLLVDPLFQRRITDAEDICRLARCQEPLHDRLSWHNNIRIYILEQYGFTRFWRLRPTHPDRTLTNLARGFALAEGAVPRPSQNRSSYNVSSRIPRF